MADRPVIDREFGALAIKALLPVLADVTEAAALMCGSAKIVAQTDELIALCRDAAALADAISLISRRSMP